MSAAFSHPWPTTGRLVAIDHGSVRLGLAICDPERHWVSPLNTYVLRNPAQDEEYFKKLVSIQQVAGWVIGLPVHNDGTASASSQQARAFGDWLGRTTDLPVRYCDERYSTIQADQMLRQASGLTARQRRKRVDQVAACVILESFLEVANQQTGTSRMHTRGIED